LLDQSPQKYKISVDSGAVRSFIEKKLKPA